ncbi:MAG TPA: YkgJ family cysteine cluster protein [Candidatus Binatia bacterium]|nr:YkgJ family cysteine cluster protein [Candidatus Binatia bacterium]
MITVQEIKCKPCREAGHCVRTGECCHIREKLTIDEQEERTLKQHVYATSGVVYLYPFARYTISLTHPEAQWMREEAKRRKLTFNVLPKKILFDPKTGIAVVYDWFVDHDVCPFLEGKNNCTIYPNRPQICKDFPFHHLKKSQLEEIKTFISEHELQILDEPYDDIVRKARESLRRQGIEV